MVSKHKQVCITAEKERERERERETDRERYDGERTQEDADGYIIQHATCIK